MYLSSIMPQRGKPVKLGNSSREQRRTIKLLQNTLQQPIFYRYLFYRHVRMDKPHTASSFILYFHLAQNLAPRNTDVARQTIITIGLSIVNVNRVLLSTYSAHRLCHSCTLSNIRNSCRSIHPLISTLLSSHEWSRSYFTEDFRQNTACVLKNNHVFITLPRMKY